MMILKTLKLIFEKAGCQKIYIKNLAPNDNSKNQVYLGGSFEVLNILPISKIETVEAGEWKKERFKASLNFAWIGDDGGVYPAPKSQLILYPKYPEVRFSGFLIQCQNAPSNLMTQRLKDRLLFFSVTNTGQILGYVAHPESEIANEINKSKLSEEHGVFKTIELTFNNKSILLNELLRIHRIGWIDSKRLDSKRNILPCDAPNCGGYTLEAELGITPNGYSEPDFLGWEVKQFGVSSFSRINSSNITLMTPEPTNGLYVTKGAAEFISLYGYADLKGRVNRMNFGGIHKSGLTHPRTNLKLELIGFDANECKIRNSDGKIALLDKKGNEAASWSFSSLLLHWNKKHNQACYVPSLSSKEDTRKYMYGNQIILGEKTDFQLFLTQMAKGNIYYDPGIKMEELTGSKKIKKRSQFRISSKNLSNLYHKSSIIDLNEVTKK